MPRAQGTRRAPGSVARGKRRLSGRLASEHGFDDFVRAAAFVGAVPPGQRTAQKDVASVGGNERGAQAIGD